MESLFIIDGNSLINRAYYALPLLANSNGVYSNAVFGFVNCVNKLIVENKPTNIVVAFDHARKTFRNDLYDGYKATRKETPYELKMQFPILKKILSAMNITCIEQEGIEADDIIGTIAKKSGVKNVVITGDRDSLQLVDANTCVWLTQKGITDIKEVNINNIYELYELTPEQIIDFKALAGDSSDNIPGVAGIGEKTAKSLISNYKDINGIYENLNDLPTGVKNKLIAGKDMCYLSYKLATIKTDCDLNVCISDYVYDFPYNNEVKRLFEEYNFSALLKKENIFSKETQGTKEIVVSTNTQLAEIFNNFSAEYFAFDFRNNKFRFSFNNSNYVLEKEITLFDLDPIDLNLFLSKIEPILKNDNVLKITSDLKEHLHLINVDINNVFDIKLSGYLLSGGNKVEQIVDIGNYYETYLKHIQMLEQYSMKSLYYDVEMPLTYVLKSMEDNGFKINKQTLDTLAEEYKNEINYTENEILKYSANKTLNIKSAKQLSEFLFDELKLSDSGNKKHSTNAEVLVDLQNDHPVIPLIMRFRKIQKLYSTYIEPYQKITENSGEIIHTVFNQMQTSTGRLSSSEPNLQNIPARDDEGKGLRKLFSSTFDGGQIISADYNQIELRLLANFSGDENLIADYGNGADIHKITASQILDKSMDEISATDRRMAKAVNFGIVYGISGFGLAKNIGVSVKEAQWYIDKYFLKYPKVKTYLKALVEDAKEKGYSKTIFNRIRNIPELKSNNGMQKMFGERAAMNMPLQGSASDIIKIAMLRVYNKIDELKLKSKLILQIHDELIVDTYPGEENQVREILINEMQSVYNGRVPLLVEVGQGETWFDCK